jgi:hypothetical protein
MQRRTSEVVFADRPAYNWLGPAAVPLTEEWKAGTVTGLSLFWPP